MLCLILLSAKFGLALTGVENFPATAGSSRSSTDFEGRCFNRLPREEKLSVRSFIASLDKHKVFLYPDKRVILSSWAINFFLRLSIY